MDEVLVSVVIPAYNAEQYIFECIDSVISQTYQNLEIIIIDDGSTDNTVNIIKNFKNERIILYQQKNSGSAVARNLGVQQSSGSWIAFLDADDKWLPEKIYKQLKTCIDAYWSHTDMLYIGDIYPENTKATDFTEKHSGKIIEKLLLENFIGTSSVMIRKNVFMDLGGFNSEYRALQDWDLWLRVADKYPVCYLNEAIVYYRVHSSSISRNVRNTLPYHIDLINRVFSQFDGARKIQKSKNEALSRSCQICSQISEQEKDFIYSSYCSAKALMYRPLKISNHSRFIKLILKTVINLIKFN